MRKKAIFTPGFTLIELMVVLTIMTIMATVLSLNLNRQRAARDIRIAQNELVSAIRQAQSYTLSSRILPSGDYAQYYLLKFDLATPTQYTMLALSNTSSSPLLQLIQTINLPSDIRIATITASSNLNPIVIARQLAPLTQNIPGPISGGTSNCALAAFSAPFGKIILNSGCKQANWDTTNDDYEKIINFQTNSLCDSNSNPPACSASADSIMTITLSDVNKTVTSMVMINGITGAVCPTMDGTTDASQPKCQSSY